MAVATVARRVQGQCCYCCSLFSVNAAGQRTNQTIGYGVNQPVCRCPCHRVVRSPFPPCFWISCQTITGLSRYAMHIAHFPPLKALVFTKLCMAFYVDELVSLDPLASHLPPPTALPLKFELHLGTHRSRWYRTRTERGAEILSPHRTPASKSNCPPLQVRMACGHQNKEQRFVVSNTPLIANGSCKEGILGIGERTMAHN